MMQGRNLLIMIVNMYDYSYETNLGGINEC